MGMTKGYRRLTDIISRVDHEHTKTEHIRFRKAFVCRTLHTTNYN